MREQEPAGDSNPESAADLTEERLLEGFKSWASIEKVWDEAWNPLITGEAPDPASVADLRNKLAAYIHTNLPPEQGDLAVTIVNKMVARWPQEVEKSSALLPAEEQLLAEAEGFLTEAGLWREKFTLLSLIGLPTPGYPDDLHRAADDLATAVTAYVKHLEEEGKAEEAAQASVVGQGLVQRWHELVS